MIKELERLIKEIDRRKKELERLVKPLQRVTLAKQLESLIKQLARLVKQFDRLVKQFERLDKQLKGGRIKHYSSSQKILLVGEGDFSFALCLARAFGSAENMVATSLDSRGIYIYRSK